MTEISKSAKILNTGKKIICSIMFLAIVLLAIWYVNGGVEYDHLIYFRYICIVFAGLIMVLMIPDNLKELLSPWNLLYIGYVPVCYFVTHYIYENEMLLEKLDPYAFYYLDVKVLAKAVILMYGLLIIAVLKDLIIKKGYRRLKEMNPVMAIAWAVYVTALIIFHNQYNYNWFIIIGFTAAIYVLLMEGRKELFFDGLKYGFVLAFVFICYKSLRHRPYDTERYMSYFVNSNVAGTFFAAVNVVLYTIICDIWNRKKSLLKTVFLGGFLFIFGVSVTMTVFNYTRTTIMGMGASLLFLIVLRIIRKEDIKDNLKRIALAGLSVMILFYPTYLAMRYIPAFFNEPTFLAWEYDEVNRVHKEDPFDSPKYTSIEEFLTLALGKWGIYVDFEAKENQDENAEAVVIDKERDVTNGRTDIWKAYIGLINAKGHYPAYIYIGHEGISENKGLYTYVYYDEQTQYDTDNLIYHAHDTYLHMAYIHGIIFAIIYVALCGLSFIMAAVNVIKAKEDTVIQDVFAFLIICICVFSQITESIVHPAYILCMMLYIAIAFTVTKKRRIQSENQ